MKRSLLYISFFIILFSFMYCVYAKQVIELSNPIIEFDEIDEYGLQGFTVVDNYLFMVLEGYDDTKSIIKVFDLTSYKEILSYEAGCLGHANDVTYNKNNNFIYVIASSGSNLIHIFDGDSFRYVDNFNIELPIRSITYIEEYDRYAVRTVSIGFLYDKDFNLISKFPFITGLNFNMDIGRQGWAYYNEYIYYTNWSWIRYGGDGANIIYIYNLDGKLVNDLYTDTDIGEIEDVAFYENKMILGFNGYDDKIKFYMMDIPDNENIVKEIENDIVDDLDTKNDDDGNIFWIFLMLFLIVFVTILIRLWKNKMSAN